MNSHTPKYIELLQSGELDKRIARLKEKLLDCAVCPHHCRVNRLQNEKGFCRAGKHMVINGYGPHYGEEDVLVGRHGSGTVFFSHCTLQCVFCQNYEISQLGSGYEVTPLQLSKIMLTLQKKGCHNINLVSPTHYVPQIVESISLAAENGLRIPIVYNTGGYDDIDTLRLLEGIIDIYMPDIKFADNTKARKYTKSAEYFDVVKAAVKEMHRQVGNLKLDDAIATRGLLIRHLVMPGNLSDTDKVLKFIAEELSKDCVVNIMPQYWPTHKAFNYPELSRRITRQEYADAIRYAKESGLANIILR